MSLFGGFQLGFGFVLDGFQLGSGRVPVVLRWSRFWENLHFWGGNNFGNILFVG